MIDSTERFPRASLLYQVLVIYMVLLHPPESSGIGQRITYHKARYFSSDYIPEKLFVEKKLSPFFVKIILDATIADN